MRAQMRSVSGGGLSFAQRPALILVFSFVRRGRIAPQLEETERVRVARGDERACDVLKKKRRREVSFGTTRARRRATRSNGFEKGLPRDDDSVSSSDRSVTF
jgi:hypothetical protein